MPEVRPAPKCRPANIVRSGLEALMLVDLFAEEANQARAKNGKQHTIYQQLIGRYRLPAEHPQCSHESLLDESCTQTADYDNQRQPPVDQEEDDTEYRCHSASSNALEQNTDCVRRLPGVVRNDIYQPCRLLKKKERIAKILQSLGQAAANVLTYATLNPRGKNICRNLKSCL